MKTNKKIVKSLRTNLRAGVGGNPLYSQTKSASASNVVVSKASHIANNPLYS